MPGVWCVTFNSLSSSSQPGVICLPGTFVSVWRHFSLSQLGVGATGVWWVEIRDAANIPQCPAQRPAMKNFLAQNVNCAEVEKFWSKLGVLNLFFPIITLFRESF